MNHSPPAFGLPGCLRTLAVICACGGTLGLAAAEKARKEDLWSLQPLPRPERSASATERPGNLIDRILAEDYAAQGIQPLGAADRLTWLRRVTFDLTGLPPTIAEQDEFLADESPQAFERAASRLLASEQHGVRYGRHWLDVLRYADADEGMPAAEGLHLWRDWVFSAINHDLPYDAFVRAQLLGHRARARTWITPTGHRATVEPRAEDLFALGFLARGATSRANEDHALAFSAVETISSAFLGMTVGCAKCHDHFYDPVKETDFYAMKALFDPLVLAPVELATAAERVAHSRLTDAYEQSKREIEQPLTALIEPYHARLYEERVRMLPPEVQTVIRKPERERTAAEQKIADDYYPILRIDPPKLREVMPAEEVRQYNDFLKKLNALQAPPALPVFWTVQEDAARAAEKRYVLNTGDPARPKLAKEVQPGFPFAPENLEFREGRRQTFAAWLTDPENPLFARVAVHRIWQWHFGEGLHSSPDFGALGGSPRHRKLLDALAAEFVARDYSMKWLHRLIVTSEVYRRASTGPDAVVAANHQADPENRLFWRFPVKRLEAEPIRDAMLFLAGDLDLSLGGKSFDGAKRGKESQRRAAYMARGYRSNAEVMPEFLTTFDVDDGRAVCPRRNQTVTAPQALFMMNSPLAVEMADRFAVRLEELRGQTPGADFLTLAFRSALGRPPNDRERSQAGQYLGDETARRPGLAWLLLNLDEFIYVP